MKLTMRLGADSYDIVIKRGALGNLGQLTDLANRKVFIVTDTGVPIQYAETVKAQCADGSIFVVPQGEASKSIKVYTTVLQAMLESAKQMNFFTMARLAWTCLREVRTDLTLGDLNALLPLAAGGGETNISMGRVPFDGAYEDATIDGMQVLRPDLERNRTLIRRFLSN